MIPFGLQVALWIASAKAASGFVLFGFVALAWLAVSLGAAAENVSAEFGLHRRSSQKYRVIAVEPVMAEIPGILRPSDADFIRLAVLDAIVYFNDTVPQTGWVRRGSTKPDGRGAPLYWVQSDDQLTVHFARPTSQMSAMYKKFADILNAPLENMEVIYHIYAPGALPTNLHLDNFNSKLFPHRFCSSTIFLDDAADGATVFPLLKPLDDTIGSTSFSIRFADEIETWQRRLNMARMDPRADPSSYRRVEADDTNPFRQRALERAQEMCSGGRAAQAPIYPVKGTAYFWRNYLPDGEDDVRAIHAACGASSKVKMVATVFVRDWAGPFEEQALFWHPARKLADSAAEQERQIQILSVQVFRARLMRPLYAMQREAAEGVGGLGARASMEHSQHQHAQSLLTDRFVEQVDRERVRQRSEYGFSP